MVNVARLAPLGGMMIILLSLIYNDVLSASAAANGVSGEYFANSAFGNKPELARIDSLLNFTWTTTSTLPFPGTFTVRWLATLTSPDDGQFTFSLMSDGGSRLWVCDHLLIDSWGDSKVRKQTSGKQLPLTKGQTCLLRLEYLHVEGTLPAGVGLSWKTDSQAESVVPSASLSAEISSAEKMRQSMRTSHANFGWGTWENSNMLSFVLLPESFSLSLSFYQISTKKSLEKLIVFRRNNPCRVYPGPHSYNFTSPGSLSQVTAMEWQGLDNVTISSIVGANGELYLTAVASASNLSDYALVVTPQMLWGRQGNITADMTTGMVTASMLGLRSVTMKSVNAKVENVGQSDSQVAFSLSKNPLVLCASSGSNCPTGDDAAKQVMQNLEKELQMFEERSDHLYGSLAEAYKAMQTVTAWNTIFDPHEGIVTPVSRGWNFGAGYVLFDWDNLFLAYMASLDNKELAYSNAIQIIKAKTMAGFVPNFSSGMHKSDDRTEPPIGAKVVHEIFSKYKEEWFVEVVFDDLMDWNTWFWEHRRLDPLGLICLGSDPIQGERGTNVMQAARFESGLDNSPMYDSPPVNFNSTTHHMQLYDVGMTSMFLMECQALISLAQAINHTDAVSSLEERYKTISQLAQQNLWDDSLGIFVNKISTTGEFYPRLSPTNFYPMLSKMATDEQVESMISKHLTNASEFCVVANTSKPDKDIRPLQQYWKASLTDNCACQTDDCGNNRVKSGYHFIRAEGLVMNSSSVTNADLLPLNLFFSEKNNDYLLTTDSSWNESDYKFVRMEGYCWPLSRTDDAGMSTLDLWWSEGRKDYQTCGTDACHKDTHDTNYKFVKNLCAVKSASALSCLYAMPSISRADPAFGDNSYWRGRIWGPMVQLVYWGLQQYDHIPAVKTARQQFCKQSFDLLMKEWMANHHVHENYNGQTGEGGDVGNSDPFYHWGALLGYISLVEQGFW